jgi:hypothetical protein
MQCSFQAVCVLLGDQERAQEGYNYHNAGHYPLSCLLLKTEFRTLCLRSGDETE